MDQPEHWIFDYVSAKIKSIDALIKANEEKLKRLHVEGYDPYEEDIQNTEQSRKYLDVERAAYYDVMKTLAFN